MSHVRNSKNKIVKLLVISSVVFLIILSSSAARLIRIKLADTTSPFLKAVHSFLGFVDSIAPFAALREENRILRDRVELLTRMSVETKAVYDENDRLRDLINFRKSIPYTSIPAQVIGRDPSNWINSLIIDKGSQNGIKQNMAVISTRGLVGRVAEVGKNFSKILLITDPNLKVGALIGRNRQGGVLVGMPGERCKLIYIALDSDAKAGDKVITAGFGSVFPKGIIIGEIEKVNTEAGGLYKYAVVRPSQDLSKLEEVLCIIR